MYLEGVEYPAWNRQYYYLALCSFTHNPKLQTNVAGFLDKLWSKGDRLVEGVLPPPCSMHLGHQRKFLEWLKQIKSVMSIYDAWLQVFHQPYNKTSVKIHLESM